ncbi:MAG: biotin/lipoyl-containing protein, partial [Nitrospinota bacterium]|nr:biotin/lipoyl-containing protein [Nitrospinota bacterium]
MKSDYLLPRENIVDEQMTVIRWHVKDRDFVGKEKKFLEVETSKTVLDLVCEEPGFIHCRVNEGDTVSVGSVLATFYSDLSKLEADLEKTNLEGRRESISIKRPSEADVAQNFSEIASSESHESVHFSKAAREYIEINNIDPNFFKGYELVTTQIIKEVLGKIEKGNEFNAGPKSGHIVEEETKTKSDQLKSKKISALKKL